MAGNRLSINSVVLTIVAVAIGIVLIGSLLAPVASDVITDLTSQITDSSGALVDKYENGATWASLVGVVVMISIVGLILVAVNQYTRKD